MSYDVIINKAIKQTIENSITDFSTWFMDDFETDICFENKTELLNLSDADYECAQFDWIAWVIDGFVYSTCELLGIDCEYTDTTICKQQLIELLFEDVKSELFKRTSR